MGRLSQHLLACILRLYSAVCFLGIITELRQSAGGTGGQFTQFLERAYQQAAALNVSVIDLVKTSAGFSRLGYSLGAAGQLGETTGIYANAGEEAAITSDSIGQSLAELVADICKRHSLDPYRDVIRHYDVTGKRCPKWYVDHPEDWAAFRKRVAVLLRPTAYAVRIGMFNYEKDA